MTPRKLREIRSRLLAVRGLSSGDRIPAKPRSEAAADAPNEDALASLAPPAELDESEIEDGLEEVGTTGAVEQDLESDDTAEGEPVGSIESIYLSDIGRIPLLRREEEIALAKAVEQGKAAARGLRQVGLDKSTAARLAAEAQAGRDARTKLIEANLRLVVSIAKRYTRRGVALMDLVQEGNIGLARASDKFDHKRGYRFSTYGTWWIRQGVTRAIADHARTIRLPVHVAEALARLMRASRRLGQQLEREPTLEELARAANLPIRKVSEVLKASQPLISLETPIGEEEEGVLSDVIADENAENPADMMVREALREEISSLLAILPERERRVLELRFGLRDNKVRTLEEVGKELGLTRERARQIERAALARLRQPQMRGRLADYLE